MFKPIVSTCVLCLAVTALAATVSAGPVKDAPVVVLQDPVEYSNAGIAIAVPKTFEYKVISSPFDVMSADIEEEGKPSQAVTLSAFPITDRGTAEEFAEAKMAELGRNLAIRNLRTHKKTPMPVAGVAGAARLVSYSFRGTKSVAAQVYFLRDVKGSTNRICYLLTVVASEAKQHELLAVLGAVLKSIQLVDVKDPAIPSEIKLEEPLTDIELNFSICSPKGWYIDHSGAGVETGLVDYRQGGITLPSVKIIAVPVSVGAVTSEACSKKAQAIAQSVAARDKRETHTLSDATAKLGDLPAHQFVIKLIERASPTPSLGGKPASDVVLVHRTACVTRPGKDPIAYMVIVTAKAAERTLAAKLMDTMGETFKVLAPATEPTTQPATQPATRPAATTQPAVPK